MKKTLIYTALSAVFVLSLGSSTLANEYDDLANDLANSIFTQLQNDIPPVEKVEIDDDLDVSISNTLPDGIFIKKERSFVLTPASLNARLNGGALVKDPADAIQYLYTQKLTKYNTLASFQSDAPLRRDEAAKFFWLFASQIMKKTEDQTKNCLFTDLAEGHTDLQTNMTASCKMGIFKGNDGFFNPTKSLTNGEALTVLIRIIHGNLDETNADHRAKNYRVKAQRYGLTQWSVLDSMKYLDKPATRWDIARLLESARFIPLLKEQLGGEISYSLTAQWYVPGH